MKKVMYSTKDGKYDIENSKLSSRDILVTHNDLDGAGCAVIALIAGVKEIYFCGNGKDIDDTVSGILSEYDSGLYSNFNLVIADNSVNEEIAAKMHNMQNGDPIFNCVILDHHKSAKPLMKKYSWVSIDTNECGTTMAFEYYKESVNLNLSCLNTDTSLQSLELFCDSVKNWDLWLWEEKDDKDAVVYNEVLRMYDISEYVKITANNIIKGSIVSMDDVYKAEKNLEEKEKYIQSNLSRYAESKFAMYDKNGYKVEYNVAFTFDSRYVSDMGHAICKSNDKIDICAIIIPSRYEYGSVELRTIKDDIDLSFIAKQFGGGGHKKAAGFPMPKSMRNAMIDALAKWMSI